MSFTVENLEFYLLILIRVSAFVLAAPFFNYNTIPMRVKFAFSLMLSIVVIQIVPTVSVEYVGIIGFSVLVIKEAVIGLILGFMCNICIYIISFAGQVMDMEMGMSMASMFDPLTRIQVSISGVMYNCLIMLCMVITNMHYYVLKAIIDSFRLYNVGEAALSGNLAEVMIKFMGNYFMIGMRIVLPIFSCMLIINVVLGVLSRAVPQMNMFVVGMQIKVLVGIVVLLIVIQTIPTVSDFIVNIMKDTITDVHRMFTPK